MSLWKEVPLCPWPPGTHSALGQGLLSQEALQWFLEKRVLPLRSSLPVQPRRNSLVGCCCLDGLAGYPCKRVAAAQVEAV